MKQFETKKVPKKVSNFHCEICDFNTSRQCHYNRHILTSKHQNNTNETKLKQKGTKIPQNYVCDCGFIVNSRTTLWRHKKVCNKEEQPTNIVPEISPELIMNILKQNNDLQNVIITQNTTILELSKNNSNTNISNSNFNSHNKTFNLQFFLNETCKDAMNITEFVDSLQLQLSDLESVGRLGYVEGISNIIVKNLKALEVHKRPVHCSDSKREVMYIKDEDKWEKENDEKKKLRKVIKRVANKNSRLLPEFKEKHPDCGKSSSAFSDQYNKLIVESMGGSGDNELEKEDKIIKKIAKEVTIDKNIELID